MGKANPAKAMAALLPLEIKVADYDLTVRPVTLGMYAALERIASPLVTGREAEDTLELIPSLYLLTHDPRTVLTGSLVEDALAWADTVGVDVVAAIRKAAARQLNAAFDVVPEDDGEPKKKRTAGSPRSSATRRNASAGATGKSSGKSPSPRSSSSGVRKASAPTKSSRSR